MQFIQHRSKYNLITEEKLHHEHYKISDDENKKVYIFLLGKKSKLFDNSFAILHVFQKFFLTFMFSPMPGLERGLPSQK